MMAGRSGVEERGLYSSPFILPYLSMCQFSVQVRRETHIGNVLILVVGLLWVAYSVFKIVRYCVLQVM